MKKIIFFSAMFFIVIQSFSQESEWLWATSFCGNGIEFVKSIDNDQHDNIIIAGVFESDVLQVGDFSIVNQSDLRDNYLIKLDMHGNVQWAKGIGSTGYDAGASTCVDNSGNIYLIGSYDGPVCTIDDTLLYNSSNDQNIYLSKFSPDGLLIWARQFGGTGEEVSESIKMDLDGNICFTGSFDSQSIDFGNITLTTQYPGYDEIFVVKCSAEGEPIWARSAQGNNDDRSYRICVDIDNNIIISGGFGSSYLTFDNITLTNYGSYDVFIAKYESDGTLFRANGAKVTDADYGWGIEADQEGNIYQTGRFSSSWISFGPYSLNNNGSFDMFVTKYSPDGFVEWAKGYGGTGYDYCYSFHINPQYEVLVTGFFTDWIQIEDTTLISNGGRDVLVLKIDGDANILSVNTYGGIYDDRGIAFCGLSNGDLVHTGAFSSPSMYFDNIELINTDLTLNVFVAKYGYPNPSIDFIYSTEDKTVTFVNQSVIYTEFVWNMGDGSTSDLKDPVYTYTDYGEYEVTLYATDGEISDSITKIINLCLAPTAGFTPEIDDFLVLFINNSTNADTYHWDFGNGFYSSKKNPVHVYSSSGEYIVSLTAANDCSEDICFDTIHICISPIAIFEYSTDGFEISFTNLSIKADSCFWEFGDGTYTNQFDPVYTYKEEGDYWVTLIVYNECGTDSLMQLIQLTDIPENTLDKGLSIYPNPAHDIVFLEILENNQQIIYISVSDISGRIVYTAEINIKTPVINYEIPVNQLQPGVYFLYLRNETSEVARKFVLF